LVILSRIPAPLPRRAAAPGGIVLEAGSLSAGYGPLQVLREIGLAVRQGEMLAVLGPNGAGNGLSRALSG
jgi:ABC-type branched-subunit amino acid transport system ATPase component